MCRVCQAEQAALDAKSKPTPPATLAEMPECVRELILRLEYLSGIHRGGRVYDTDAEIIAAVRDHYAKGGQ